MAQTEKQSPDRADRNRPASVWKLVFKYLALTAVIVAANITSVWLVEMLGMELTPANEPIIHNIIMASVIGYVVLIAVPFVPGIELGIALLVMGGSSLALLVYCCTVLGLFLGFMIGYCVPYGWLQQTFRVFHFERGSRFLENIKTMKQEERIEFVTSRAPTRVIPFLVRHRYIALAVALNIPGNVLIGGGGGICMAAGMSRLYSLPVTLITIMIAVMPVPLAVLVFGKDLLTG